MTRLLPALLVLAAVPASVVGAGLPQLVIKGRDFTKSLPVAEASLSVEFEGRVAEIIYEIAYQNDTDQRHEGEFVLQLPPGATVSTYAIDVRGEMRPAVSVEKERARNAYESIKRRMVDPGIVEREADNTYRTRVFPIEPRSVKRVRIGYLREVGLDETLELPLDCEGKVGRFELILKSMRQFPEFRNFTPPERKRLDSRTMVWVTEETELTGSLVLPPSKLPGSSPSFRVEGAPGGVRHFVAQGNLGPPAANIPAAWQKVRVIWDASYSGRFRDHEAEFAALDQIWKWLGEAKVSARVLDTDLSPPFEFALTGGDGRALRESLEKVRYDGAADFSKLDAFDGVTLIVSDGRVSSPLWAPPKQTGGPVLLLKGGAGLASPWLLSAVDAVININAKDLAAELEAHRDPVVIEGLERSDWLSVREGNRYRITGILPLNAAATLRLRGGGIEAREFPTATTHGQEEWNFTRRLWAQDRLNELEWQRDRKRIEEHAMAERLASDFTSLIVLERMEDHLRYRIPPPEPDLLTEYRQQLPRSGILAGNAMATWNGKRRWYQTDFPWIDTELREEIATVAIFAKAAREVFPEAALGSSSVPKLEAWLPEAGATVAGAGNIKTEDAYRAWQAETKARFEALAKIRNENELQPPEGAFPVSVRGFVNQRGIVEGESPFALLDAVGKSGGPSGYGSLSRVFLYRDGQRTGYNLESVQADPVHLRPCDMIVVESLPWAGYLSFDGFADPFADSFMEERPAASAGAPVFEAPGQARPSLPVGANLPRPANARRETGESSFLEAPAPPPAANGSDVAFLADLRAAADPAAHYRQALAGPFGKDPVAATTVLESARFLYFKSEPALAWRVLTTLGELEANPIEATRALAFWLIEFGEREKATELLESLLDAVPDQSTRSLVGHDLARINGKREQFLQAANDDLGSEDRSGLVPVLLTDFFALEGRASGLAGTFPPQAMPSDLRLVVSCAGGGASLEVATPGRPQFRGGDGFGVADEGAWQLYHPRVVEYQIRRALPGTYQPSLERRSESGGPVTVRIDAWLRWGKENEERRSVTILLDRNQLELPALVFGWGDGK